MNRSTPATSELVRAAAFAASADDEGAVVAARIARAVAASAADIDVRTEASLAAERYEARASAWRREVEARRRAHEERQTEAFEREIPFDSDMPRRGGPGVLGRIGRAFSRFLHGQAPPEAALEHSV